MKALERALAQAWRRLVAAAFGRLLVDVAMARPPDFVIGGPGDPYIWRWHLFRRRWAPGAYLHRVIRSDDDRALHDHPWWNVSIILAGSYVEHTIAAGGIHVRRTRRPGAVVFRRARAAHRLEITDGDCWTLFLRGPVVRRWGFHCPERGWVFWRDYVAEDPGEIGAGCGS